MKAKKIEIIPITGIPIVQRDDDIAQLIATAMKGDGMSFIQGDILVVSHSIVSVAEGSVYEEAKVSPSERAIEIAAKVLSSEAKVEIALEEAAEIIREEPVLITKTKHGIITDFSGVDESNAPIGTIVALPRNPDASAIKIHNASSKTAGFKIPVIITDTQGRPWRKGAVNLAIGVAGMSPFIDNKGRLDIHNNTLRSSMVCIADEIAASAELVMGQADEKVPIAIVRGVQIDQRTSTAQEILRTESEDLFL